MEKEKILVYDGSFNGFLTSVFIAFDQKINVANIQRRNEVQKGENWQIIDVLSGTCSNSFFIKYR